MVRTAQQAMEENNNSPFSAVKSRAIPTYPMMNTRREGQRLPTVLQTRLGKEAQALWRSTKGIPVLLVWSRPFRRQPVIMSLNIVIKGVNKLAKWSYCLMSQCLTVQPYLYSLTFTALHQWFIFLLCGCNVNSKTLHSFDTLKYYMPQCLICISCNFSGKSKNKCFFW